MTRSRTAYEMRQTEQFVRVMPRQYLGQRVRSGDEEELVLLVGFGAEVSQRVDRVGRPWAVDVYPADAERRVRGGGDHRHQVPVLGRGDLAAIFLVRLSGRDEDNF